MKLFIMVSECYYHWADISHSGSPTAATDVAHVGDMDEFCVQQKWESLLVHSTSY
jgi:hypothetical protein